MNFRRILSAALASLTLATCFAFASCDKTEGVGADTDSDTAAVTTEAPVTTEPVETQPVIVIPEYTNPLTGLAADSDRLNERPVAVMVNNLYDALPQEGILDADIMYECLVEGGITRLMCVISDYEDLGVIGSVRSSRPYYLDLTRNHDAIYVHAGGSDDAYIEIKSRGINNLDGVNMYIPNMFYRDEKRLETMKYEHTLMTTGEKIKAGIEYKKYRTTLDEEYKGKDAFNFVEFGEERVLSGDSAKCVWLPYSKYQTARFDYNSTQNVYFRYQFEDMPHMDGERNEQISFTNLLILICEANPTGDSKGHIDVVTENEHGEGYYCYGGKCEKITWSKPTADSQITYYGADGNELVVNRGKTFISIFPDYNEASIEFDHVISSVTDGDTASE